MGKVFANRGSLVASLSLPRDGKRIRWRLFFGFADTRENRRKAEAIRKDVQELIAGGRWADLAARFPDAKELDCFRVTPKSTPTFKAVAEKFLAQQVTLNAKGTSEYYRVLLEGHLYSFPIAEMPIRLVAASDIASLLGEIKNKGHVARANKVRIALSAVFNFAMAERGADAEYLVVDNPVRRTKPLKRTQDDEGTDEPGGVDPFTREEVARVIHAGRDGWERRLVTVALGTGMRPGETFGLKRADIDLSARTIRVRRSLSRFGVGAVKTLKSRRTVDMAPAVYEAIKEQLDQVQLRSDWVWPDLYHHKVRPHSPHNFSRRNWPAILKRAELTHREFYQCRHIFATLMLKAGADWQYIGDQMGHADLSMLQKFYWKWKPGKPIGPAPDVIGRALGLDLKTAI
jgi:integrase